MEKCNEAAHLRKRSAWLNCANLLRKLTARTNRAYPNETLATHPNSRIRVQISSEAALRYLDWIPPL